MKNNQSILLEKKELTPLFIKSIFEMQRSKHKASGKRKYQNTQSGNF